MDKCAFNVKADGISCYSFESLQKIARAYNRKYNDKINIPNNKSELKPSKMKQVYSREDIKDWISFGIKNDYVNKVKKDQVAKWVDLILKHGVVKMNNKLMLDEDNADLKE